MKKPDPMPDHIRKDVSEFNNKFLRIKHKRDSVKVQKEQIRFVETLATKAAEGDIISFETLVRITNHAVNEIRLLTKTNFPMAVTVAQHASSWPISLSLGQQMSVEQKQLVKKLDLASRDEIPLQKGKVNGNSNTARIVANLLIRLTVVLRVYDLATSKQTEAIAMAKDIQASAKYLKFFPICTTIWRFSSEASIPWLQIHRLEPMD